MNIHIEDEPVYEYGATANLNSFFGTNIRYFFAQLLFA